MPGRMLLLLTLPDGRIVFKHSAREAAHRALYSVHRKIRSPTPFPSCVVAFLLAAAPVTTPRLAYPAL